MKYTIIEAWSSPKLTEKVKDMIELGWTPLGGIAIAQDQNRVAPVNLLLQAMIKNEPSKSLMEMSLMD